MACSVKTVDEKNLKDFVLSVDPLCKAERTCFFDPTVEYPSGYFKRECTKPKVRIPESNIGFETLEGYIKRNLAGNLNEDAIIVYMWRCLGLMTAHLDDDWTCYGIDIGKKEDAVTAQGLLHAIPQSPLVMDELESVEATDGNQWQWILIILLGQHVGIPFSKNELHFLFSQDVSTIHWEKIYLNRRFTEWRESYDKLAAAIDMFLYRFPRHKLWKMRHFSQNSRFKQCEALKDLNHLSTVTSYSLSAIRERVWANSVRDDLSIVLKEGEEIDDPYSYFPYLCDMGLCNDSPYSSSANRNLVCFVHIVGALLGSQRSIASGTDGIELVAPETLENAFMIASAKLGRKLWYKAEEQQFSSTSFCDFQKLFKMIGKPKDRTIGAYLAKQLM